MWGQKPKIITDALVLGESLKASGTRARMVACVAADTLQVAMSVHLERFWEVMPVEHLKIQQDLVEGGMQRSLYFMAKWTLNMCICCAFSPMPMKKVVGLTLG